MSAPPKFATPRDLHRRTLGGAIGLVADALGKPLMPWQQQVADTATELDGDGNLVYELVLVTVPRQSGKTTLVGSMQLHRAMTTPRSRCFYTAQTGKDARTRFEDLVNLVQGSALTAVAKPRWSAGSESISFPNGSSVRVFAPTFDAIHGETPPLVTFDEIWKYDEALGNAMLEGAVIPAQSTLVGRRQVWMISTAGTALSTFMRKWVERGRESAQDLAAGRDSRWPKLAYFEWSLADGDDPYDPASLERFHPAVGYTVTAEDLLASKPDSHAEWLRAFCNVWLEASEPLFSAEEWAALAVDPTVVPARRELAITYEIGVNSDMGAIMASWRDVDGVPCTRVLHAAPGTTWMHDLIVHLYRTWKPAVLGADDGGPTRRLTDQLRRTLGDDAVVTLGARDFATASDSFLELVRTEHLKHDGSKTLAHAIAHLALKRIGDVTRFDRAGSTGSIASVVAAAVGIWLWDHRDAVPETFAIHI